MRFLFVSLILSMFVFPVLANDWPQWLGPQRDGVWREDGLLERFPEGGLKALWRVPLGTGYAGPAVANGKVYIMDRSRKLDAEGKPVKPGPDRFVPGYERLVCLSANDGKQLWEHKYECNYNMGYGFGPRATPTVAEGRVYILGGMGDMKCLDAEKGTVIWEKSLPKEYGLKPLTITKADDLKALEVDSVPSLTPFWGYAGHLLLDGDFVYSLVGGPGTAVVAFDKKTGKEIWRSLSANEVCYAPPMIYTVRGVRHLIVWLDTTVNGLDPATGRVYWSVNYPDAKLQRPAVAIHTPRLLGDKLFLDLLQRFGAVGTDRRRQAIGEDCLAQQKRQRRQARWLARDDGAALAQRWLHLRSLCFWRIALFAHERWQRSLEHTGCDTHQETVSSSREAIATGSCRQGSAPSTE
jgi:hypothetical protein